MKVKFKKENNKYIVEYICHCCNAELFSPVEEIDGFEKCPECNCDFIVPGLNEYLELLESSKATGYKKRIHSLCGALKKILASILTGFSFILWHSVIFLTTILRILFIYLFRLLKLTLIVIVGLVIVFLMIFGYQEIQKSPSGISTGSTVMGRIDIEDLTKELKLDDEGKLIITGDNKILAWPTSEMAVIGDLSKTKKDFFFSGFYEISLDENDNPTAQKFEVLAMEKRDGEYVYRISYPYMMNPAWVKDYAIEPWNERKSKEISEELKKIKTELLKKQKK